MLALNNTARARLNDFSTTQADWRMNTLAEFDKTQNSLFDSASRPNAFREGPNEHNDSILSTGRRNLNDVSQQ